MAITESLKKSSPRELPIRANEPYQTAHHDERARQLADIAASGDQDNAECAAADLAREFPTPGD